MASVAEDRAKKNLDELFILVRAQAAAVADLPGSSWEAALGAIHAQHERSGVEAGMSRETALDMADRLDAWIRAALTLASQESRLRTLH